MLALLLAAAAVPHGSPAELRHDPVGTFKVVGEVRAIAVAPDGSYVAAVGKGREVTLWRRGQLPIVSTPLDSDVSAASVSPDGGTVYAVTERGTLAALGPTGAVRWRVSTGGPSASVLSVSPDGGLIAVGNTRGSVELRHSSDGSLFRAVGRHERRVVGLGFRSAGRHLLSADDEELKGWEVYAAGAAPAPGGLRSSLMGSFHIFGMSVSSDHTAIVGQYRYMGKGGLSTAFGPNPGAFLNEDDHMMVFHGGGRTPEHTIRTEIGWNDLRDVSLTSDSRYLAVATERRPDAKNAGMAVLWEIEREEPRISIPLSASGRAVSVSADGQIFAAGDAKGLVVVHRVIGMENDTVAPGVARGVAGGACGSPRIELDPDWRSQSLASARSLRVAGRVTDPCGKGVDAVWANGERVSAIQRRSPDAVRFSAFVGLAEGEQQVVVRAVSESGGEARATVPVRANLPPATQVLSAGVRRARALVVGISRYADPSFNLSFADRDARALADFLTSGRSLTGLAATDVSVLLNEQATLRNLSESFTGLLEEQPDDDVIILFYAGHGAPAAVPGRDERLFLVPHDAVPGNLAGSSYPMDALRALLGRSGTQHLVVFADACHSGAVGAGDLGGSPQLAGIPRRLTPAEAVNRGLLGRFEHAAPSRVVFASAERNQIALEPVELQSGVFSHFLLRGLEGEADENADRVVTLGELIEFVRSGVRHFTKGRQVPAISPTSFDRELPLAVVQ